MPQSQAAFLLPEKTLSGEPRVFGEVPLMRMRTVPLKMQVACRVGCGDLSRASAVSPTIAKSVSE